MTSHYQYIHKAIWVWLIVRSNCCGFSCDEWAHFVQLSFKTPLVVLTMAILFVYFPMTWKIQRNSWCQRQFTYFFPKQRYHFNLCTNLNNWFLFEFLHIANDILLIHIRYILAFHLQGNVRCVHEFNKTNTLPHIVCRGIESRN